MGDALGLKIVTPVKFAPVRSPGPTPVKWALPFIRPQLNRKERFNGVKISPQYDFPNLPRLNTQRVPGSTGQARQAGHSEAGTDFVDDYSDEKRVNRVFDDHDLMRFLSFRPIGTQTITFLSRTSRKKNGQL